VLGPRALAGLIACVLVLLPGLLTAELIARGYEARLTEDARGRAMSGLDAATGLVDAERTRTLNNADLAASRLGLLVGQGTSPDALVNGAADLRAGLRTTLVTLLDSGGRTLASDPASNLPFGNSWEAKQALQGKSVVVLAERTPGFAVQAAAPLRVNGEIVPGAAIVAQNLDDGFLNTGLRLTGLDVALIQNGRLVAASRGIRRSFAYSTDQTLDAELIAAGPDHFKRVRLGSETFFLAARTLTSGQREVGMLLVGSSADATADAVRWARALTYGAALAGALLAGLIGARVGRWQARRVEAVTARVRAIAPADAQVHAPVLGKNGLADDPSRGCWSDLDATVQATAEAVGRRAEAQRHQAARLEAVLGSLADGVIVADEQRRVIFANPVARQLLHLPDGDDGPSFVGAGDGGGAGAGVRPGDAPGSVVGDGPGALIEHDASQRVIRSYAAPVLGDGGQPLGFVTVLRDATREQEVEQARAELLGVVSHELQTPLTAIKGALELVVDEDEGGLSRVQRRFLDTIDRNCARMIGLVGDLLDLSRMDAGRLELDSRPLDTPSIVAGSVAALANLFEQRHQSIQVDVPPETPPILGDRRRVEQILTNLLSNAAKYTPDGGEIEVTAGSVAQPETSAGRVWIAVADSGPGIPEAEREQVFGRFYRGKDAGRRGETGSGLGLAIVRSLVELHGGEVRATAPATGSRARGARFVVDLPAAPDDSE
jgi:signal transduction histidine kinase